MRTLKKYTKKSRKYRKTKVSFRRGGEEDTPLTTEEKPLTSEEKKEAEGFKKVIEAFLEKEPKTPTLKYAMNIDNFKKKYNSIKTKSIYDLTREEYEGLRDLTNLIIKDDAHDLFFNTQVAQFTALLKGLYESLLGDQGIHRDISIEYLKNITNGKPFVKVNHAKEGYNTVHDVNNLFAYIQNEVNMKIPSSDLLLDKKSITVTNKINQL
jgi:hypothetical protein